MRALKIAGEVVLVLGISALVVALSASIAIYLPNIINWWRGLRLNLWSRAHVTLLKLTKHEWVDHQTGYFEGAVRHCKHCGLVQRFNMETLKWIE